MAAHIHTRTHKASHPPWHAYHPSSTHKHLDAHTIAPPAHKAQTPAPPFPTACHANTQPGTQTHTGGVNAATTARHPLLRAHAGALERGDRVYLFFVKFFRSQQEILEQIAAVLYGLSSDGANFRAKNNDLRKNAPNKIYYV